MDQLQREASALPTAAWLSTPAGTEGMQRTLDCSPSISAITGDLGWVPYLLGLSFPLYSEGAWLMTWKTHAARSTGSCCLSLPGASHLCLSCTTASAVPRSVVGL